jgi:hypothetical protein
MAERTPVVAASRAVEALTPEISTRKFLTSVRAVIDALALVPDYAPPALSHGDLDTLQTLGERAIAAIELRLAREEAQGSSQVELARAVYDLRRELEELDRWRKHYRAV